MCNKSQVDRTGWDFIVEFPFPKMLEGKTLDKRGSPISCHVQVKAIKATRDRFVMRLSSAERLAKEVKPTFIYVLQLDEDARDFGNAYLVHILDGNLAKILQRLRKEHSKGNLVINRQTITMSIRDGVQLAPNGPALRAAIEAAVGPDLHAYTVKKTDQRHKLGYEERPFETQFRMQLDKPLQLVDVFLGLQQNVPIKGLNTVEKRFGIKLAVPELSNVADARITITPSPADTCKIIVRADDLMAPAVFDGKILLPVIPGLPRDQFKALIQADLFSIVMQGDSWSITVLEPKAVSQTRTLETWSSYARLLRVLALGSGTIELRPERLAGATVRISAEKFPMAPAVFDNLIAVCDGLTSLLRSAAVSTATMVSWAELTTSPTLAAAGLLANGQVNLGTIGFVTERPIGLDEVPAMDMVFASDFSLAGMTVAYYGVGHVLPKLHQDRIEWRFDQYTPKRAMVLTDVSSQWPEFIEKARLEAKIDNIFAPTSKGNPPSVT